MEAALLGLSGRTVLESAVVTIGFTEDNQCVVNDAKVSSHHAEMRLIGQGYSIIDLSSANGTFVNEQRLEGAVSRPLNAGDMIRIGDTTFRYEVSDGLQVTPNGSAPPGQVINPPVVAAPSEFTAYGQHVGEDYQSPPPEATSGVPTYAAPAPQPSYTLPPTQRKSGSGMRILFIVLTVIFVLGVGSAGIATYLLTRPQPVISVTSDYHVESTPAGSIGTVFHVSGHKFSGTSVITFLLDGLSVAGDPRVASDADGNVKVDLTVTNAWAVGSHILTAKDANDNVTRGAVSVLVVPQGQAHTPGPNGAPADEMSFTLNVKEQYQSLATGKHGTFTEGLIITGRPDPAGGTVCRTFDDGQPLTYHGDADNGTTYTATTASTCSGTYKGGKLSYTETATSDKIDYSDGTSCLAHTPYVLQHLEGTFNAPNSMSGTLSLGGYTADCNKGLGTVQFSAYEGTWTGQL